MLRDLVKLRNTARLPGRLRRMDPVLGILLAEKYSYFGSAEALAIYHHEKLQGRNGPRHGELTIAQSLKAGWMQATEILLRQGKTFDPLKVVDFASTWQVGFLELLDQYDMLPSQFQQLMYTKCAGWGSIAGMAFLESKFSLETLLPLGEDPLPSDSAIDWMELERPPNDPNVLLQFLIPGCQPPYLEPLIEAIFWADTDQVWAILQFELPASELAEASEYARSCEKTTRRKPQPLFMNNLRNYRQINWLIDKKISQLGEVP
jgi:hypothetical protein